MWHCPHCGAPQAETARCWVCRRSSTTCSTCRHFRTSLATDLGYCGLDPKRRPLTGLELRGCWEEGARRAPTTVDGQGDDGGRTARPLPVLEPGAWQPPRPPRTFVPVDEAAPRRAATAAAGVSKAAAGIEADPGAADAALPFVDPNETWEDRTSLFGEAER